MADIITTLHPENDAETNLYPNIKKENIPSGSIDRNKLNDEVNNLLNEAHEQHVDGVDTSAHILAFTSDKGIWIGSDTGNWYYWNGTQYVSGGTYQATALALNSVNSYIIDSVLNKKLGNYLPNKLTDYQKGYWTSSSLVVNDYAISTIDYIDVNYIKELQYLFSNSTYAIQIAMYDKNYTYLGGLGDGYKTTDIIYTLNKNCKYVRFNINKRGNIIQLTDLANIGIYVFNPISKYGYKSCVELNITSFNLGAFNHGYSPSGVTTDEEEIEWFKLIGKLDSDIIISQECPGYFRQNVTPTKRYGYLFWEYYQYNEDTSPNIIFGKYKVYNVTTGTVSNDRPYTRGYIKINNIEICILDFHATPGTDATAIANRQTEFNDVITLLSGESYFIMGMDSNINTSSELDIFRSAGYKMANCDKYGEFITYVQNPEELYPMDNILTSSNLYITDVELFEDTATSDHRALKAKIQVRF